MQQWIIKPNGGDAFVIIPPKQKNIVTKADLSKLIVAFRQVRCGELNDGQEGVVMLSQIAIPSLDVR